MVVVVMVVEEEVVAKCFIIYCTPQMDVYSSYSKKSFKAVNVSVRFLILYGLRAKRECITHYIP